TTAGQLDKHLSSPKAEAMAANACQDGTINRARTAGQLDTVPGPPLPSADNGGHRRSLPLVELHGERGGGGGRFLDGAEVDCCDGRVIEGNGFSAVRRRAVPLLRRATWTPTASASMASACGEPPWWGMTDSPLPAVSSGCNMNRALADTGGRTSEL